MGHGNEYYIADPELACIKCAEWQLEMLSILLSGGAAEALRIKESFVPQFASKEDYFAYIASFYSKGDRIAYVDGGASVKL